ncbi:TPA: carbohydrate ABC transporter permease [bacterium]|jgi:multiple sugar transport system permease protein|nr:carbohydrate ABC transporter permease [bacterium]
MKRKSTKTVFMYILLVMMAIIMVYPFVWAVTASFKTNVQIYSGNPLDLIPRPLTVKNYIDAWTILPFYRFLLNSAVLSIIIPAASIIISSMAGYSFARLKFKGRDLIFLLMLGVMMLPGHVTLIPNYALMRIFGWINKYAALIIPPIFGASLVFNIFFMRQYFLGFPKEIEESAVIDGCSYAQVWWNIMLPNAKPAIATIAIISFKNEWNTFLWPNVVINDYFKMPIQVGLSYFKSNVSTSWGTLMAATTMAIIPLIVIFIIFQRYFISGMLTSGLTGR